MTASATLAIELRNINKTFGAVRANHDVNLQVRKGSIHGIVGENGAGKSTLMSILYGFYEADSGSILCAGKPVRIRSSADAIAHGIGMVHQHFMLVDTFSVLENVMLGAEQGALLRTGKRKARASLEQLEREYDLRVDLDAVVGDLPVGQQQRVEILKALYRGAEILILDEPTGVLTPQEADQLFRILRALQTQGVTILLITHKLREIMDVTDQVSVMRQGAMVAHCDTADTSAGQLAELMVGRKVSNQLDKSAVQAGPELLRADHITLYDSQGVARLKDISFSLRGGEILGVAGVSGNGQSELLEVLSGIRAFDQGQLSVNGQVLTPGQPGSPRTMRAMRVNHIPEDRLRLGLIKTFSAAESSILGYQQSPRYNGRWLSNGRMIHEDCQRIMYEFDVRPPDPKLKSANFSGGNQQKLIIARELDKQPQVLLVGQPTRGVDIGAIEFIHQQLLDLRDQGCAILLVSVELDEIMALSDRIIVLCGGAIVGAIDAAGADKQTLGLMMANALSPDPTGTPTEASA